MMQISPLRQFMLAVVLWLPACFFLWAWLASPVIWPVARVAELMLKGVVPDIVTGVEQIQARLEIDTQLLTTSEDGRAGSIVLEANPLIYAWCLPLFAGLVMATPLTARRRLLQLAIGMPVLWLIVSVGACFDALKLVMFDAGPLGQAALTRAGWSADAVALGYQFSYLILPSVVPVALWVGQNRVFIESLLNWRKEPRTAGLGRSDSGQSQVNKGERG